MTQQPPVLMFSPGQGFIPVPQNMWGAFSSFSQASTLLAAIKKLSSNAIIQDGTAQLGAGQAFMYQDSSTRIWIITGQIEAETNQAVVFQELAGSLWDRASIPNPFIDRDPKTGQVGGPNLHYTLVATGLAQLFWGE